MISFKHILGDAYQVLPSMADESIDHVMTSPPYWCLRDYGLAPTAWPAMAYAPLAGMPACVEVPAMECCLGLEPSVEAFIGHLVLIFREVRRVLKKSGSAYLNMGDCFITRPHGNDPGFDPKAPRRARRNSFNRSARRGKLPSKNLVGQPWRLALALQADGWILRRDVIWSKTNPMPEEALDRPATSHEYLFLLTKSPKYFFDAEAVKEPVTGNSHLRGAGINAKIRAVGGWDAGQSDHSALTFAKMPKDAGREAQGLKTAAKFGHSPGWRWRQNPSFSAVLTNQVERRNQRSVWTIPCKGFKGAHFATFPEALVERCIRSCCPRGGTVFDPFLGSGTTGAVAVRLGRNFTGIEKNPNYLRMADTRVGAAHGQGVQEVITLELPAKAS